MKKDTFTYVAFTIVIVAAVITGALLLVIGDLKQQLKWKDESLDAFREHIRLKTNEAFEWEHYYDECKATLDALKADVEICNGWAGHYRESESWYRHGYICLADKECYACVDATGWNSDTITIDIETCGNNIFGQMFGEMNYSSEACMADINCAACLDQTNGDFEHCIKYALYP